MKINGVLYCKVLLTQKLYIACHTCDMAIFFIFFRQCNEMLCSPINARQSTYGTRYDTCVYFTIDLWPPTANVYRSEHGMEDATNFGQMHAASHINKPIYG